MNEAYRQYLIDNWKEAENIGKEVGAINNHTIATIFSMITQPYYYWKKEKGD